MPCCLIQIRDDAARRLRTAGVPATRPETRVPGETVRPRKSPIPRGVLGTREPLERSPEMRALRGIDGMSDALAPRFLPGDRVEYRGRSEPATLAPYRIRDARERGRECR